MLFRSSKLNSEQDGVFNIPTDITTINYNTFAGCTLLEEVTIGTGIVSIGECAFSGCVNLRKFNSNNDNSIIVPDTVENIGRSAFSSGANITEITIPFMGPQMDGSYTFGFIFAGGGGVEIKQYPNYYRIPSSLTKVTVTKQTWIQSYAFANCANFEEIVLPTTITTVGKEAFYGCSSLKQINLGNEVESIGEYAFYGCSGLSKLNSEQDGVLDRKSVV